MATNQHEGVEGVGIVIIFTNCIMKKNIFVLISFIFVFSCKKESKVIVEKKDRSEALYETLKDGHWDIIYFTDTGFDKTSTFTQRYMYFIDSFVAGLSKVNPREGVVGSWKTYFENEQTKLYLNFQILPRFYMLTNHWTLRSMADSTIVLEQFDIKLSQTDSLILKPRS